MKLEYRGNGLAVPGGQGLGEVHYSGDLALDPVRGSGSTAAAALRPAEIAELSADRTAQGSGRPADYIRLVKRMDPGMASCLTWATLLLVECRRVMGSTELVLKDAEGR